MVLLDLQTPANGVADEANGTQSHDPVIPRAAAKDEENSTYVVHLFSICSYDNHVTLTLTHNFTIGDCPNQIPVYRY